MNSKILYYVRQSLKLLSITGTGFLIITAMIFIKYKPLYKVSYLGQDIGYVKNKAQIEEAIITFANTNENNIAFVNVKNMPEFELEFVSGLEETQEIEVLENVKEDSDIIYRTFAISLDGENKTQVSTIEEAETIVEELKQEYVSTDVNIGIHEVYTENSFEEIIVEAELAKNELGYHIDLKDRGVNGILLSNPVTGQISSRYGSRWGGQHTGLDIAGAVGTPIKACSDGVVTFSGTQGGYGNLIIISHGNGVETYYAHCNELYAKKGEEVKTGDVISTRGNTGNSTGPHLHLEVKVDGKTVNPQNYLYK